MLTYPEDCIQRYYDDRNWWQKAKDKQLRPGRLLQAFIPHVSVTPKTLTPIGRQEEEAGNHGKANYQIGPLRINSPPRTDDLPVAGLTCYSGECFTVHRSKKRYCLLISVGGADIPKEMRSSMKPSWHTDPTLVVAPFYGCQKKGTSKWFQPFVERIIKCEYPQYLWDTLPVSGNTESSILRFDHLQPIGRHHDSYELTDYVLKEEAMEIIHEWIFWLSTGEFEEKSTLNMLRNELLGVPQG